jgi:hypothetical protein
VNLAWDKAELESISDQVEGFDVGEFGFDPIELPNVLDVVAGQQPKQTDATSEEDDTTPDSNTNFKYESQYGVIVMCSSEEEQEQVYNRLTGEGYSCKVVSV